MWLGKLPTSTATMEKFHYKKLGRYNSTQEHYQETKIPITPSHSLIETISIEADCLSNSLFSYMAALLGY